MKTQQLWLTASVLALAWCGAAQAQTTAPASQDNTKAGPVQEVVVTAERRSTNLQNTPIAATVLTAQELTRNGVFTVDQLQFISPSLTVDNFGQGDDFDIRGIGKGEHNTETGTGVVVYRDGVASFPGYFQEEPYYDIQSVEVLRGPQGTFSGQNATGGAVIVNTNNPVIGGGYDGYILGHYGNYNDTGVQGAVNLPINDTLAARLAVNTEYRNSFYDISGPWKGDGDVMQFSGRFSLLWQPIPSLKVLWKTDYNYLDNGGYFGDAIINATTGQLNGTKNLFNFSNNYGQYATDQFGRSSLKIDYVPSSGIDFRSVTAYQMGRTAWTGDIDGTANGPLNYAIDEGVDETLWSQEFNIISPDKGPITWIVGAYYQHNFYNYPSNSFDIAVPPGAVDEELNGTNSTHSTAIFGQLNFKLPAGFELQLGLRYSDWATVNHVFYNVPEFPVGFGFPAYDDQNERGVNTTGKVTLNWNFDRNNFLYVFVASGAKPGGLNNAEYFTGPPPIVPGPFGQEYVTDYEFGWKTRLFNNHLHLQVGGYYNEFQHFQVIVPIPSNPLLATEINDPSRTKLYGLEGSAQATFGDFQMNSGLGLEHSSLGKFYTEDPRVATSGAACDPASGPATPVCFNLQGHPQTYAPDFTFNINALYNFHLGNGDTVTPNINYAYISDQWATLFDNVSQGDHLTPRRLLGASVAWKHGTFTTTLYGSNLTNDQYVSADLSPIQLAGAPRQFGVSVMKVF